MVAAQQFEAATQTGQHPERQNIDLQQLERINIVLVPLQDRSARHGGVADHRHLGERTTAHDEAADMGGEVAGEVLDFGRQLQRQAQPAIGDVEPLRRSKVLQRVVMARAPIRLRKPAGYVLRQPERLADFADGAAAAIADYGADDGGAIASIAVVDVLDDLLAPLVLEIDVDVGRLVAAGGDEALEQQIVLGGIDGGDAEHVADGGVGRRSAPLAEDAFRAGEAHHLVDGEEIGRVVQLLDQRELVRDPLPGCPRAPRRSSVPAAAAWTRSAKVCERRRARVRGFPPDIRDGADRARTRRRHRARGLCWRARRDARR